MKRIAVLTSGGDAPGMNAAIRAIVRAGVLHGYAMFGVRHGYSGLIAGDFTALGPRDVGGIIQQGGTVLGTSRCDAFKNDEGRREALARLEDKDIAALIVIGGNGSQTGAHELTKLGVQVIGVASTIDNDLLGTDLSIGASTALDTALEAIDRLRVTACAHGRAFLVEVMGRHCGYLAAHAAIAGGAEALVVPEVTHDPEEVVRQLQGARHRGKHHAIIVVAEGAHTNAEVLAAYFDEHAERLGFELRVTRLGHVQRGGAPNAADRLLATRLGVAAIDHYVAGTYDVLIGLHGNEIGATALSQVAGRTKPLDLHVLKLAHSLAL